VASATVYAGITAWLGRDVVMQLGSVVANDPGDPLLNAAILSWNAAHVPLTEAWWQFPIFAPTRDALTLSEHLLGLNVLASPIHWATGDPLVTYNIVFLLTFPLCALAMYALVHRLTGCAAGAFVAGLAFGFAPYRVAQLSHVQLLAVFWTPLALLGLHAYLESGRRRWLASYALAWMLQAATSGYLLVHLAILSGLWVLWFAVWQRRWRAAAVITATTVAALLPLAPVLARYIAVHAVHGFERSVGEATAFSADLLATFCAPDGLVVWGWLRAGCYPEGVILREVELFPGLAVVALSVLWVWRAVARLPRAAVSSVGRGVARRDSTIGFYVTVACLSWMLALGPVITFMGMPTPVAGLYAGLLPFPGIGSLRVPARFWMSAVLGMSVVAGGSLAELLRGRRTNAARLIVLVAALGVLSDGWLHRIPVVPGPAVPPGAAVLTRATVLELPPDGGYRDTAAVFRAVRGDWSTINGYSGYFPNYYPGLRYAARAEADDLLVPFRRASDLHVLVPADAPRLTALVERQPGAELVARDGALVHYRLVRSGADPPSTLGEPIAIARLESDCAPDALGFATDADERSVWSCADGSGAPTVVADLGGLHDLGALVHSVGPYADLAPVTVRVETSEDGNEWGEARSGGVLAETVRGGLASPRVLRIAVSFAQRRARYVRLAAVTSEPGVPWTIAELEVWSGLP
jgi:hypothetical protein